MNDKSTDGTYRRGMDVELEPKLVPICPDCGAEGEKQRKITLSVDTNWLCKVCGNRYKRSNDTGTEQTEDQ